MIILFRTNLALAIIIHAMDNKHSTLRHHSNVARSALAFTLVFILAARELMTCGVLLASVAEISRSVLSLSEVELAIS